MAILMLLAVVLHSRRGDESANVVLNVILGGIATLIALGRLVVAPF
ncbi:MAG: hypothetical protein ACXWXR_07450 [Candidatus Limnocylindrales bacterium]